MRRQVSFEHVAFMVEADFKTKEENKKQEQGIEIVEEVSIEIDLFPLVSRFLLPFILLRSFSPSGAPRKTAPREREGARQAGT